MSPRTSGRSRAPRAYHTPEISDERQERAWRAIKEFQKLTPTFTSFARALTGNSAILVRPHPTQSMTDGRVIHIAPPIALGDRQVHDRAHCEMRDPVSKMKLCKACATRELLMRRTYHEISHIIFDSLDKPLAYLKARMIRMINEWHPSNVCDHQMEMLPRARAAKTYLELGAAFSSYLVAIFRCHEDARVDSKMYRVRPGLKAPTEASLTFVFTQGIQRPDGTFFWRDAALEGQVTIGLMLLGMGIEPKESWLSDEAREILADPELKKISERVLFAGNPSNAFEVTLDAFEYLQTKGLMVVPKCSPIPSLPQNPEQEDNRDSGSGDGGSGGGDEEGAESSNETDSGDSADPSGRKSGEDESSKADSSSTEAESGAESDDEYENEESTRSGSDSKDSDSTEESDEAGVSSDGTDEESSSQEKGGGDLVDDDDSEGTTEQSSSGLGSEQSDEESDGMDGEPADSNASDESAGDNSDSSESGSGDDESDAIPGAVGFDPSSDSSSDPLDREGGPESGSELEDDYVSDGDPPANQDEGASESGRKGTAPPSPEVKGAEVWEEENPETEVIAARIVDLLEEFHGHGDDERVDADLLGQPMPTSWDEKKDAEAVAMAVSQAPIFDTFSGLVDGLEVIEYPDLPMNWGAIDPDDYRQKLYEPEDFMVPEQIIGKALMHARVVFAANKRAKKQRGLRSGKVSSGVLGRRAAVEDDRLFQKAKRPGKRDYEVSIAVDVSGSTRLNDRLTRIKRAVFAQAELLNRLGVKFSIYAHTGGWDRNDPWSYGSRGNYQVWLLKVKGVEEQWGLRTRTRLAHLNPLIENLDGHTIEFHRKMLEKSRATDKILLYYTDGAMPAANRDEELDILQRELVELDKRNITKVAVGINTDSPSKHGFDTVQVDCDEDLVKVVEQLRRYLT